MAGFEVSTYGQFWVSTEDLNTQIADYWLWNPKSPYRNRIPAEIVDIFEKHGFIWGASGRISILCTSNTGPNCCDRL